MKFQTLCSGSKGNCSVLETENALVLIDCGIGLPRLEKSLSETGLNAKNVTAVFLTHEHSDHISGLDAFCKKYPVKVFVHKDGFLETAKKLYYANQYIEYFADNPFEYKDIMISTYSCPHDSSHCCAYRFDSAGSAIAIVTDLGTTDEKLLNFIENVDLLVLESNHDEEMLRLGDYPFALKKRIGSTYGHLSNRQAGEFIRQLPEKNVRKVWLGHLSMNNNTPETAFQCVCQILAENKIAEGRDLDVGVVTQFCRSEVFYIEKQKR